MNIIPDLKNRLSQKYYPLSLKIQRKPPRGISLFGDKNHILVKNILNLILLQARRVKRKEKHGSVNMMKLLDNVIPDSYFGTKRHRKKFYTIVMKILTASRYECVYFSLLTRNFDFISIPWLAHIPDGQRETCLLECNLFVLDNVVKPLIRYFHFQLITHNGHEQKLFPRNKWQSFRSRVINNFIKLGYLEKCNNSAECKPRGLLKLIPKDNCDSFNNRPLMTIFPNVKMKEKCSLLTKTIYASTRQNNDLYKLSFYDAWVKYIQNVGNESIYGVKVDVEDAFGNVNLDLLHSLISNFDSEVLSEDDKIFILNHIQNQFIVLKNSKAHEEVYVWKHGLLQGDRLSSCLCELYMCFLDRIHLKEFTSQHCFLHRTVDDIIFFSTKEQDTIKFLNKVSSVYILNKSKTVEVTEKSYPVEIPYCGHSINVQTKEIRQNFNFKKPEVVRNRFRLWNIKRPIPEEHGFNILNHVTRFCYNSFNFNSLKINTVFNTEETVLRNVFDGFIFLAYKLDAAFISIKEYYSEFQFLNKVIDKTIRKYCNRILSTLKTYHDSHSQQRIHFWLLKSVAWNAFILVFKRRPEVYKNILNLRNYHGTFIHFELFNINASDFKTLPSYFKNVTLKRVPLLSS